MKNVTTVHLHRASSHAPVVIVFDVPVPNIPGQDDWHELDAALLLAVLETAAPAAIVDALHNQLDFDNEEQ